MKQPKKRGPGRPPLTSEDKFTFRYVISLTPAIDDAAKRFCEANGIVRQSEGLRQLIVKALRVEGYL